MSSTNIARGTVQGPQVPARGTLPSAANQFFARKTIVTVNATGFAVSPSNADASGFPALGVSNASYDNRTNSVNGGGAGDIDIDVDYGVHGFDISGATPIPGDILFVVDNQTVSTSSNGATRGVAGLCSEVREENGVNQAFCWFGPYAAHLVETINVDDLHTDATSTHARVFLPIQSAIDIATGAPLLAFANGASATPGLEFSDTKAVSVRWNNHATPGAIALNTAYPADLDDTEDVHVLALVSKVGATIGDATSLTIGAFEIVPGALVDADVDFGGASSAVVGNAATKTVSELSLTLLAANVHPYPAAVCLTIKPTAGLLGTDDFLVHAVWLEYTRKLLVA